MLCGDAQRCGQGPSGIWGDVIVHAPRMGAAMRVARPCAWRGRVPCGPPRARHVHGPTDFAFADAVLVFVFRVLFSFRKGKQNEKQRRARSVPVV